MAVPKRRTSPSRQGNRRAHHALTRPELRPCPHCGAYTKPHVVCPECGYYNGKQVVFKKVKKVKTEAEG